MNTRHFIRKQLGRGRRGVVLVVVVMAVSVASTLGMTVLTAGSTNAMIAANVQRGAQAEYLADSALNIAIHQLKTTGTLGALTGVSIAGIDGTADLVLVDLGNNQFEIQANARIGDAGAVMSYKTSARVEVDTSFIPEVDGVPYAAGFAHTAVNFPTVGMKLNVTGNVISRQTIGNLDLLRNVRVFVTGLELKIDTADFPAMSDISTKYNTQYTYEGMTYNAQPLADVMVGNVLSVSLPRPEDLATNPAGVYYSNSNSDVIVDPGVTPGLTINGTLRLKGKIVFKGESTLTPKPGFPALLVDSNFWATDSARVTINGLTMIGGQLTRNAAGGLPLTNANSVVTVNGAFLLANNGTLSTTYTGTLNLNYDRDLATVNDFTTNPRPRVTLLEWTP